MSFGPQNMTFPNWLVEQISQGIRNGVTYPDFWNDRYEDDEKTKQGNEEKKEEATEEKKAAQA